MPLQFRRTNQDYNLDWHPAPTRQFVVTLSGESEVELEGGKKLRLGPGHILLAEDLMGKGFAGTAFLTTDDVHADYEELKGRGVQFTEPPEERPYGIDTGFRDPSGNYIRLGQIFDLAALG